MGHHYVPRYYLRGFAPEFGDRVWVYDKVERKKFCTNVKNIAHETKLYTEAVESKLAIDVEAPANTTLDKIRAHLAIDHHDKLLLAKYLVALWKRVPKAKDRLKGYLPRVAAEVGENIYREIDRLTGEKPHLRELGERRKAEVAGVLKRHQESPPDYLWHYGLNPDTAPRTIETTVSMRWRFFVADCDRLEFLTSDNPVFFFEHEGIGKPQSELCFPVSNKIMLWATWRTDLPEGYLPVRPALVKEFNRRTVWNSRRYVFAHTDEPWILRLVLKSSLRLTRIR